MVIKNLGFHDGGKILDETMFRLQTFCIRFQMAQKGFDSLILKEILLLKRGVVKICQLQCIRYCFTTDIVLVQKGVGVRQVTDGKYVNINVDWRGLIRVQDSYYYQQFSYEVQVGNQFFING
ncbi:MAG: hypothetical protein CM15mV65_560 [Caudoviricetes sp.]|nr:MAG: hypothetical protein CM15mV65_560 [Caudoviricetes sp.]